MSVKITLREITEDNEQAVRSLRTRPDQEQFVSTVAYSFLEGAANPQHNPWCRAVYADGVPVGLVMVAWDFAAPAAPDRRPLVPVEAAYRPSAPGQGLRPRRSCARSSS